MLHAQVADHLRLAVHLVLRGAVDLDQQHRAATLVVEMLVQILAGSFHREAVHELDRGWDDAQPADDHRHDLDRALHIREQYQQVGFRFWEGRELDGRAGYDPQGAFRADVNALQVVTRNVLDDLTTDPNHIASWCYHLHAGNVAVGHAILDSLAAAGIFRDVPADLAGLEAHRIAGEEQAVVCDNSIDLVGHNTRLDFDHHVLQVNVEHLVHFFKSHQDAAVQRDRAPGKT